MLSLKKKILKEGILREGNILKVDNFLNHQLDIKFLKEIGKAFRERFNDINVEKIVTIESSGIAIASITSEFFNYIPVVFAKKTESKNLDKEIYKSSVFSYTKNKKYDVMISKRYINKNENILIIDDFLANGEAVSSLIDLIKQAGANIVGVGIVIEKSFQRGANKIKEQGVRLESLVRIKSLDNKIEFLGEL